MKGRYMAGVLAGMALLAGALAPAAGAASLAAQVNRPLVQVSPRPAKVAHPQDTCYWATPGAPENLLYARQHAQVIIDMPTVTRVGTLAPIREVAVKGVCNRQIIKIRWSVEPTGRGHIFYLAGHDWEPAGEVNTDPYHGGTYAWGNSGFDWFQTKNSPLGDPVETAGLSVGAWFVPTMPDPATTDEESNERLFADTSTAPGKTWVVWTVTTEINVCKTGPTCSSVQAKWQPVTQFKTPLTVLPALPKARPAKKH